MLQGPFIIVEGADGVGKTRLAKEIADHGFTYAHTGPPEGPLLQSYLPLLSRQDGPTVVDRLHLSTYAYGNVFHNGHLMSEFEEWLFNGWLLARGVFVVACTVPWEVAQQNLSRGPDDVDAQEYEVEQSRRAIWTAFDEAYQRTPIYVFRYDYTKRVPSGHDAAEEYAQSAIRSQCTNVPSFDVDMIGNSARGRTLFVGDRPNGWEQVYERSLRFADPQDFRRRVGKLSQRGLVFNSTSGRYLFHALRSSGLTLNDYVIMNALQWDGLLLRDLVPDNRWWFEARDIVAMGESAANELEVAKLPYRRVPHPSWWKRFRYRELSRYARLLSGEEEWVS